MKTVIVTGGSRGIGKCIAENLAKEGYNVVLNYNKSVKEAKKTKEELEKQGIKIEIYKLLGDTYSVNTRHIYAVKKVNKPFKITSISEDNIIESIEYIDNNNFILGVQFHPEDMNNTEKIYNYFLKEIIKRKNKN